MAARCPSRVTGRGHPEWTPQPPPADGSPMDRTNSPSIAGPAIRGARARGVELAWSAAGLSSPPGTLAGLSAAPILRPAAGRGRDGGACEDRGPWAPPAITADAAAPDGAPEVAPAGPELDTIVSPSKRCG